MKEISRSLDFFKEDMQKYMFDTQTSINENLKKYDIRYYELQETCETMFHKIKINGDSL